MVTNPILLCFIISTVFCQAIDSIQPDQIIEIFRHGAKTPESAAYDPRWTNFGELTPVGMRQQYILGKVLANKYSTLLGTAYDYNTIYMLSDTFPRCIQSALAHLYGIYINTGPALNEDYPSNLAVPPFKDSRVKEIADSLPDSSALPYNYMPTIVNIANSSENIFQLDQPSNCPNSYNWIMENAYNAKAQEAFAVFNDTINTLNKYLNESQQITSMFDLENFDDTLITDLIENMTLDGINNTELINNITYGMTWAAFHYCYEQEVQRQVSSFGLIDTVLQQLANFRQGENYNKVALFSGHDSNIIAILSAFGIFNEDFVLANFYSYLENKPLPYPNCYFPYFASNLIIEFYNNTDSPYVKFYYNNALIPLCNGQPTCSYDDFVSFAKNATGNLSMDSYRQLCTANTSSSENLMETEKSSNQNWLAVKQIYIPIEIIIIIGLVLLLVLLTGKMIVDRKRFNEEVEKVKVEKVYCGEYKEILEH